MAYNPNAEVNRLDQRIDEVTDETLDATRRILQTAEETNKIGVDTLVTLNEQGGHWIWLCVTCTITITSRLVCIFLQERS